MATVIAGDFEWDHLKAEQNLAKHAVSFEEAVTVFADPDAFFMDDGADIGRIAVIGMSIRARALLVVHVVQSSRGRIISARPANRAEEQLYTGRDER